MKTREQRNGGKEGENDRIGVSESNDILPHDYSPCQEIFGSDPDKLGEKWLDRPTPLTGKHLATSGGQGCPWLSVGWARRVLRAGGGGLRFGPVEEGEDCGGIEIEHLGAGELATAKAIETQDGGVDAVPGRAHALLPPVDHDFFVAGSYHARFQAAVGLVRLQGYPGGAPTRTARLGIARFGVGERGRPEKLGVRMDEVEHAPLIAALDGAENFEHHFDVFLPGGHDGLLPQASGLFCHSVFPCMPGAEQIITPHYDWHACGHGIRLRLMYRPHFSHKKGGNEWTQSAVVLHAIPSSQTPRSPKSQAKQSSPPRPAT